MKGNVAEALADYSGAALEVREGYRGRGMTGETVALVGDEPGAVHEAVANVLRDAHDFEQDELVEIADALERLRQDGMGQGYIWY